MEKKLRVGIVGCGGIANGKHMPSLAKIKEVEMVAFCDIVESKARDAAAKYGTPDSLICTDYKEIAADPSIDVVHVCTPNKSHANITIDMLNAGKHVMCEKPMAKTAADAKRMVEAYKASGKKLTIGYQGRYTAQSLYLKQLCDAGELGEIYYAKAHAVRRRAVPTWGVFLNEEEQGGGPLIDIGTHALDLTLWMMNNYEVESVTGSVYRKLADTVNAANAWGPWDPKLFTVEDAAFGFIKMKNGATIQLDATWAINMLDVKESCTTLCGTKAGADMDDGLRINGEKYGRMYVTKPDLKSGGVAFYDGTVTKEPQVYEARQWIDSILNDTLPTVLPEQALVVSQILEAVYESAKTGKPVYFK